MSTAEARVKMKTDTIKAVVKLWNVATGKNVESRHEGLSLQSPVFSPDGRQVAAIEIGERLGVFLWETDGLKRVTEFKPFPDIVYDIAFAPHGKLLA